MRYIELLEDHRKASYMTTRLIKTFDQTPQEINNGWCWGFAKRLAKLLGPDAKVVSTTNTEAYPGHSAVEYHGKYYDSETPIGVANIADLGYSRRMRSFMSNDDYEDSYDGLINGKLAIKENDDIKPVIDPTKLEQARADGFNVDRLWYHGTRSKAKFANFRISKREGINELGRGVYLTKYPGTANTWAQGHGRVLACVIRQGKLFEMSNLNATAIWSSGPDADDRFADPIWRELYRGFEIIMRGMESAPGANDAHGGYRDFAERINRHEIEVADCLKAIGYIGVSSRYSQIRGQVLIWSPDDVRIVGEAPGFEGWSYDPDDDEDRARKGA